VTEIKQLIQGNSHPENLAICTDWSVVRGIKSGWGFLAEAHRQLLAYEILAHDMTPSSMRLEVEAVSAAIYWM